MSPRVSPVSSGHHRQAPHAFTLAEMLVVLGIITLLLGLLMPAITSLKGGRDATGAAYDLAGALETARNYAISSHTYTWVGFYEQDFNQSSAPVTPATPKYPGVGHMTIGIVYSKDGTKLVDDPTPDNVTSVPLPPANLGQVGKIIHLYGVHLAALDKPTNPNSTQPGAVNTLQGRPYQNDLADKDYATFEQTLISSDSPDTTVRPFAAQGYTFYKTIRFNPHGEANVNSTLACTRIIEFGLQPTHGSAKDADKARLIAVQQTGIGGAVNIYRP